MLIFTKIKELQAFLSENSAKKRSIGFVPTMGALHEGHISLINASNNECDVTVCSIFVNPTQFNDKSDLQRYPKTPEQDIALLRKGDCDAVFMPSVEEIYPVKDERVFDFGYLDKILEGEKRPGHFNGVALVVSRLFEIVNPDKAFFGSKDYQQVMIIKALVLQLNLKVQIVVCPTVREKDGLAMSSRNTLLSAKERETAAIIPELMKETLQLKKAGSSVQSIKEHVISKLSKCSDCKPDYFVICDADTLREINSFSEASHQIALIACYVGKIRLIDNIVLS